MVEGPERAREEKLPSSRGACAVGRLGGVCRYRGFLGAPFCEIPTEDDTSSRSRTHSDTNK